jgi:hypothetical protein
MLCNPCNPDVSGEHGASSYDQRISQGKNQRQPSSDRVTVSETMFSSFYNMGHEQVQKLNNSDS